MQQSIGLGDTVSLQWASGGYDNGTVSQVHADGTIDVFRPYVHHADFSSAGSREGSSKVICYLGFETVDGLNPERVKLIRKSDPLR